MLRPVASCRYRQPGLRARPAGKRLRQCIADGRAVPGRLIRSRTVVPPRPARISTSSQTRRASARPLPPGRPPSGAAVAAGRQRPLSRISACTTVPPATRSSSRAAGDPYRTALTAISWTAMTKSSALSARRPARAAHAAVTRRTCRRSPAPNRSPHGAGRSAPRARPGDPTPFPLPPGRPGNKPGPLRSLAVRLLLKPRCSLTPGLSCPRAGGQPARARCGSRGSRGG
jgi:hypothetical protein